MGIFNLIRFIPIRANINFMKFRKIAIVFSTLIVLGSIASVAIKGMNWGIDFSGGISMDIKSLSPDITIASVRKDLVAFKPEIQEVGKDGNIFDIRIGVQDGVNPNVIVDNVKATLGDKVEYRNTEVVGPKVGGELVSKGIWAVCLALLGIALYIWIRFDSAYARGGLIALGHDIIATIGLFSLFQMDFSLTTVAAVLTIAGYSINDTVVCYDKLRENAKKYKKLSNADLINLSLNETLSRTVMTSGTTLLAIICIYSFGGEVLRGFSTAMLFGITIGTYSSVFIAMPILLKSDIKNEKIY